MASQSEIQALAEKIVREFQPGKIILFGSHARGDAGPDSDLDLLVIMPRNAKEHHQQAAEIHLKCHPGFPFDVLVRNQEEFEERLTMRDWFMRDSAGKARSSMRVETAQWVEKAEGDWHTAG
jgi:predicted nucleotidyltransferase